MYRGETASLLCNISVRGGPPGLRLAATWWVERPEDGDLSSASAQLVGGVGQDGVAELGVRPGGNPVSVEALFLFIEDFRFPKGPFPTWASSWSRTFFQPQAPPCPLPALPSSSRRKVFLTQRAERPARCPLRPSTTAPRTSPRGP